VALLAGLDLVYPTSAEQSNDWVARFTLACQRQTAHEILQRLAAADGNRFVRAAYSRYASPNAAVNASSSTAMRYATAMHASVINAAKLSQFLNARPRPREERRLPVYEGWRTIA